MVRTGPEYRFDIRATSESFLSLLVAILGEMPPLPFDDLAMPRLAIGWV
jgi:hypothetical protein